MRIKNEQSIEIRDLLKTLKALEALLQRAEKMHQDTLDKVHPDHREGARNLIHYLTLRQNNLESIQRQLTEIGLSSLGRSESCVLSSLRKVIAWLEGHGPLLVSGDRGAEEAHSHLMKNTSRLFGKESNITKSHIILTAPDFHEVTSKWVRNLLKSGMTCLRINCAHGSQKEWLKTISILRSTSKKIHRPCKVMMDLAGPKIRTDLSNFCDAVQLWKPKKSELGVVSKAKMVLICPFHHSTLENILGGMGRFIFDSAILLLDKDFISGLKTKDSLFFIDARGKRRRIAIVKKEKNVFWGELSQTTYIMPGTTVFKIRKGAKLGSTRVDVLYNLDPHLELSVGSKFYLVGNLVDGKKDSLISKETKAKKPPLAEVACGFPDILKRLQKGQRVLFDDGKIESMVERMGSNRVLLRVIRSPKECFKLKNEKGINFPETDLGLRGLTSEDRIYSEFVIKEADIVSLSFVNDANDIKAFLNLIRKKHSTALGLVLKIETQNAFRNLPSILFEAMKYPRLGVMIARGDLAVEVGFERLAEVQEEILWICEAADIPVIWATQVLENMAKTGLPSRAEVTDAAMSGRAEAVMLNKGPYIHKALESLANILVRMQRHQSKKKSLMKELNISKSPVVPMLSDSGF